MTQLDFYMHTYSYVCTNTHAYIQREMHISEEDKDLVACLLPVNSIHSTFVASHYKVTTVQVRCHYHLHFTDDKTEAKAL